MSADAFIKGRSPFYPGQPVPLELFVGRQKQIDHIRVRGVGQVALGKPVSMYVRGEYGIGKSSIAAYCQAVAEKEHGLLGIYAALGGVDSLDEFGERVLEAAVRAGALDATRSEKLREFFSKYIAETSLFGVKLKLQQIKADAPDVARGLLPFLEKLLERLKGTGTNGIFLVLDEINGIAANPRFAPYLKSLVDTNALAAKPVPLLLMLCGVEARRSELIRVHQSIDRVFDIVDIGAMSDDEVRSFFARAFESVHMTVAPDAMSNLIYFSAGVPKIMHLVGDEAFWLAKGPELTAGESVTAVIQATEAFGRKYIDAQVYEAIRSKDYIAILSQISEDYSGTTFGRAAVRKRLTEAQQRKFDNFLQKMQALQVIQQGQSPGEWRFIHPMILLYVWLRNRQRGTELPRSAS
jgi:AAA ATPase domain